MYARSQLPWLPKMLCLALQDSIVQQALVKPLCSVQEVFIVLKTARPMKELVHAQQAFSVRCFRST